MQANEAYYQRLLGVWKFTVHFEFVSLKGLLKSSLKSSHKLRMLGMLLSQAILGPYKMQTVVAYDSNAKTARHSLKLHHWGQVFYKSEKRISLDANGFDLRFSGEEYFWPRLATAKPFRNLNGRVGSSALSATYQWPMFEASFPCETLLTPNQGVIRLDTGWLKCSFQLTEESLKDLNARLPA